MKRLARRVNTEEKALGAPSLQNLFVGFIAKSDVSPACRVAQGVVLGLPVTQQQKPINQIIGKPLYLVAAFSQPSLVRGYIDFWRVLVAALHGSLGAAFLASLPN
ncbi:hypothetical protein FQZ97_606490 [compost metagenome]